MYRSFGMLCGLNRQRAYSMQAIKHKLHVEQQDLSNSPNRSQPCVAEQLTVVVMETGIDTNAGTRQCSRSSDEHRRNDYAI